MIEDVEELAAEAKLHSLGEMKVPLKRDVGLRGFECAEIIAWESPCCPAARE